MNHQTMAIIMGVLLVLFILLLWWYNKSKEQLSKEKQIKQAADKTTLIETIARLEARLDECTIDGYVVYAGELCRRDELSVTLSSTFGYTATASMVREEEIAQLVGRYLNGEPISYQFCTPNTYIFDYIETPDRDRLVKIYLAPVTAVANLLSKHRRATIAAVDGGLIIDGFKDNTDVSDVEVLADSGGFKVIVGKDIGGLPQDGNLALLDGNKVIYRVMVPGQVIRTFAFYEAEAISKMKELIILHSIEFSDIEWATDYFTWLFHKAEEGIDVQ